MNNLFKIVVGFFLFSGFAISSNGQEIRPRVAGLERDSVYLALLTEENGLKSREDSLRNAVREERARFATDTTNLYIRSREILRAEETLFAIRNQLGVVASRINEIEQRFIMQNLFDPVIADPVGVSSSKTNYADLIDNDYFKDNLSGEEYRFLRQTKENRSNLQLTVENYRNGYEKLKQLAESYDQTPTQSDADSVFILYRNQLTEMRAIEVQFEGLWRDRFSQQIYLYSYLLDKLNRMDDLSLLNEKARAQRIPDSGEVMSVALAEYPFQQEMLVEYELVLAKALNLHAAIDSLTRVRERIVTKSRALPKIEITEKDFVRYEDVFFPSESPYTTENPIPELFIPESGTYYSITVGTFSQRQAVSIFRGAAPIYYERQRNGQWRYFAGLFRSYGDALEAVQQLKSAGFHRPEPVRWKDKTYENLASQAAKEEGLFRIEINGVQGELPGDVRYLLDRYARSKEITRVGNVFYVGTFTNRIHLDDVMQALQKIEGLDLKIEELEE